MYYLKHEQTPECFISDKARTASVLNGLKNDPSYEFIGEVILKLNVVWAEKIKVKVYVNEHDFLSYLKPPTRQWFPFSLGPV